jgi:hypothetical protein
MGIKAEIEANTRVSPKILTLVRLPRCSFLSPPSVPLCPVPLSPEGVPLTSLDGTSAPPGLLLKRSEGCPPAERP